MKVWFIGAGPGASDLITIRGKKLVEQCPVILYAGSLIPEEILQWASDNAKVVDSASLHLDEIITIITEAQAKNQDVARLHSGDPSIYGAIGEQIRRLDDLNIDWEIVPGVTSVAASAAILGCELTLPNVSQSVIFTRTAMKSSKMPNKEDLVTLGQSGATLALHLSVRNLRHVEESLIPLYGADCPAAIIYRATWPDELVVRCRLDELKERALQNKITRTALIIIGQVLEPKDFPDSHLYHKDHKHILRTGKT